MSHTNSGSCPRPPPSRPLRLPLCLPWLLPVLSLGLPPASCGFHLTPRSSDLFPRAPTCALWFQVASHCSHLPPVAPFSWGDDFPLPSLLAATQTSWREPGREVPLTAHPAGPLLSIRYWVCPDGLIFLLCVVSTLNLSRGPEVTAEPINLNSSFHT